MISLPLSPPINAYWTWNDRDDSFVPYSINATVDIELAYMQFTRAPSHTNAQSSIDLSKCGSQLPYTINFYAMFQTRHGYGTQRAVRREVIPGGQSLQDLLQPHTSVNSSSHLVSLAGGSGFSLATGPATSMMLRSGTSRGSGGTLSVAQTASVPSATKPTTRKGRGKKNSPTLSSTAMGRGGDAEVGGILHSYIVLWFENYCDVHWLLFLCVGFLWDMGIYKLYHCGVPFICMAARLQCIYVCRCMCTWSVLYTCMH